MAKPPFPPKPAPGKPGGKPPAGGGRGGKLPFQRFKDGGAVKKGKC